MPRQTPFYSRTSALCESQSWQEWAGFLSANTYELEHNHEYYAIRTAAALLDISPLYKYHIHGRDAFKLVNRVVTRDVGKCAVGQVIYTPWCDDAGKIIDDGTLSRLEENFFRLTAADPTYHWLRDNAVGLDVHIEDVTEGLGALALQGPTSRDILAQLADVDLSQLKFFRLTRANLGGIPATISRTGYTGDLGYEIWVEPGQAEALWDRLMEVGQAYRLRAVGNVALDMARIEAGLLLINVDFVSAKQTMFEIQKSTPYELGLGWTVHLDKPYFVGQTALRAEKAAGPAWATVGLEVNLESLETVYREFGMPLTLPSHSWNEAVPVYAAGRQIGKATSGTWSSVLKKYVALARLKPQYAKPGTRVQMEVTVEAHRRVAEATVVGLPFYEPERKKA
ncbi:MAG: aminomethyl transferase family protein [Anaerolineae bacterium]|nr:aminomethyl transferase family protein [Anaerolineales bacterium]MCQ3973341.1 aminomethyl transferase family protein [Anaerolineae bacterium]